MTLSRLQQRNTRDCIADAYLLFIQIKISFIICSDPSMYRELMSRCFENEFSIQSENQKIKNKRNLRLMRKTHDKDKLIEFIVACNFSHSEEQTK